MKNRFVLSAVTLALLGVSTDQNITMVNAVATKSQAQLKAKSSSTLKALLGAEAKAEAKVESKAGAKVDAEDYFSQPFEQVLAQSTSFEDALQEQSSFDKMPTQGIDLGGLKDKVEDAAKPVTDQIDEKDKQAMKEQAAAVAGDALKKPAEPVKVVGAVVNSPEAHIVAKAAGGQEGEAKLKQTQEGVNKVTNVVGGTKAQFQKLALDQFPNFEQISSMQQDSAQQQQSIAQNDPNGSGDMPIVSQIQALDQFGNVIAAAQNPKMDQIMNSVQRSQQQAMNGGNYQQAPPSQLQQPQYRPREQNYGRASQQYQQSQGPSQFMAFQTSVQSPPQSPQPKQPQQPPAQQPSSSPQPQSQQQQQKQQQQMQQPNQPTQAQSQQPQYQPSQMPQQQPQQQFQAQPQQQYQQAQPQYGYPQQQQQQAQQQAQQQNMMGSASSPGAGPRQPSSVPQDFDQAANLLQKSQGKLQTVQLSSRKEEKKTTPPQQQDASPAPAPSGSNGEQQQQQTNGSEESKAPQQQPPQPEAKKETEQKAPGSGSKSKKQGGEQLNAQGPAAGAAAPQSSSPFSMAGPGMNSDQQQQMANMFYQQQMAAHMYQQQMMSANPMAAQMAFQQPIAGPMPYGMFLQGQPMPQANPYMFQMPTPSMGPPPMQLPQQQFPSPPQMMAQQQQPFPQAQQQHQPYDLQFVQHGQDMHLGGVPQEILDLEQRQQQNQQHGQQKPQSMMQSQHGGGSHTHSRQGASAGGSGRPHDFTNLQTKDFIATPYGMMWQPSPYQQFYAQAQQYNPYMMGNGMSNFGAYSQPRMMYPQQMQSMAAASSPYGNAFLAAQQAQMYRGGMAPMAPSFANMQAPGAMTQQPGAPNNGQSGSGAQGAPNGGSAGNGAQQAQGKGQGSQGGQPMQGPNPGMNNMMHSQWGNMQMSVVPPGMQPYGPYPPQMMMPQQQMMHNMQFQQSSKGQKMPGEQQNPSDQQNNEMKQDKSKGQQQQQQNGQPQQPPPSNKQPDQQQQQKKPNDQQH